MSASSARPPMRSARLQQLAVAVARGGGGRGARGPSSCSAAIEHAILRAAMAHIALQTALAAAVHGGPAPCRRSPTKRARPYRPAEHRAGGRRHSHDLARCFGFAHRPLRLDLAARRRRRRGDPGGDRGARRAGRERDRGGRPRRARRDDAVAAARRHRSTARFRPRSSGCSAAGRPGPLQHRCRLRLHRHRDPGRRRACCAPATCRSFPPPPMRAPPRSRRSAGSPSPICASRKARRRCRWRSPPLAAAARHSRPAPGCSSSAAHGDPGDADPARPRRARLGRHRGGRASRSCSRSMAAC